ncbi:XRE family transcriptional regulator [Brevibacillus laterosporus]|uniref:XRE family transcriptional regulator n=1 Tax=Brevibacillus laterosporus TaxID=1465 RepID=A0A502HJY4_BRELA|nr:helix-turn-helix transcriptional regulator [Brevibacillus laterosporus]QDX93779.1 XRE family transcriptional regulator [Brevibacillus laterosporus]TPG73440.1 XRE family transcriptional regulator [Brevibacillus laterosporus]TPG89582.1 XRE family transcriptional regulator [Brevibacillus laterosporus]
MQIRLKLDAILKERRITQREFSRMTNIRFATINGMCKNETQRLQLDNLAKICEVLGVGITDVLELH